MSTYATRLLAGLSGALLAWAAFQPHEWTPRVVMLAAAALLAVATLFAWRRDELTITQVMVVALLLRLFMLPVPAMLSDDVWRYLWDGLVQTYGINPYHYRAIDLASFDVGDLHSRINRPERFTVYPPISQIAFVPAACVLRVNESPLLGYAVIKLTFAASELVALLLLARLLSPRTLVLYAWNPLILIEAVAQVHTEALMLPLLVGCLVAVQAGRWRWAGVALGGAVMVKLYPLLLLPLLIRRGGWQAAWPAVLVVTLLAVPYATPAASRNLLESIGLYTSYFEFNAKPYELLRDFVNWYDHSPENVGKAVVGRWLQGILVVGTIVVLLLDWRHRWSFDRSAAAIIGLYLVTATTVHPWYALGLFALPWVLQRPAWHWLWFGVLSLGTYLRYPPGGEAAYEAASWLAWGGWLVLLSASTLPALANVALRIRAARKASRIARLLDLPPGSRLLDLGCGEGYVGHVLSRRGHEVTLADVVDFRDAKIPLPFVPYDGRRLPFHDDAFDAVVLYFVLHHAEDADRVLAEALRVGRRVIVVESVHRGEAGRRILWRLDTLANRLRGSGAIASQEPHLVFRTAHSWRETATRLGAATQTVIEHGLPPHRQATLVLTASLKRQIHA